MLTLPRSVRVYLASQPMDMRCGHDGLMAVVKNVWAMDPYGGHLFAFIGMRRDRMKLLYFDRGGFVLVYKRLERGCFQWPKVAKTAQSIEIDGTALAMLLDGIDLSRVQRPRSWEPTTKMNASGIDKRSCS